MKKVLTIALFTPLLFLKPSPEDRLFYEAVKAEASGDLTSAILLYEKIAETAHSANLHGNLANLYFKTKDYGRSVLNYKRALILDPNDREFRENLNFTKRIAAIPSQNSTAQKIFAPNMVNFCLIVLCCVFWIGGLLLTSMFFIGYDSRKFLFPSFAWLFLIALAGWAYARAESERDMLNREAIAIFPANSDSNESSQIPLRKFAGNGSSANAFVKPGESLWFQLDQDLKLRSHVNQSGQEWFLVHTEEDLKKGWVKTEEISPLIQE